MKLHVAIQSQIVDQFQCLINKLTRLWIGVLRIHHSESHIDTIPSK